MGLVSGWTIKINPKWLWKYNEFIELHCQFVRVVQFLSWELWLYCFEMLSRDLFGFSSLCNSWRNFIIICDESWFSFAYLPWNTVEKNRKINCIYILKLFKPVSFRYSVFNQRFACACRVSSKVFRTYKPFTYLTAFKGSCVSPLSCRVQSMQFPLGFFIAFFFSMCVAGCKCTRINNRAVKDANVECVRFFFPAS